MKITQDVREYAAKLQTSGARAEGSEEEAGISEETVAAGMQEKAQEFRQRGSEVYLPESTVVEG
jgi:hypothetical protein